MRQEQFRPVRQERTWLRPTVILLVALGGCATVPEEAGNYLPASPPVELGAVPFYPQERYQCGPAALTTVLAESGVDASLESIVEQTYLPARRGTLQLELVAAARANGRIPYRIDGTLAALQRELAGGRPVLVLQNLGVDWFPRWHYAVVVGVDPVGDGIVLRSGTERRRVTRRDTFLRTWQRGDFWAMVVLTPGELPAAPDRDRYFDAVSAMEAVGDHQSALAGWRAALGFWPDATVARFGAATALYNLQRYAEAEQAYGELLRQTPDMHSARNNRAYALARLGRRAEAVAELEYVLARIGADDPFRAAYEDSLAELRQSAQ